MAAAEPRQWRMLSRSGEYALRAAIHLAAQPAGRPVPAVEIAQAVGVTERYMAKVVNTLAHAGVFASMRGAHGGFRLARPPSRLTLAEVLEPFDPMGEHPKCLLRSKRCDERRPCIAHDGWKQVAAQVRGYFRETTLSSLVPPS